MPNRRELDAIAEEALQRVVEDALSGKLTDPGAKPLGPSAADSSHRAGPLGSYPTGHRAGPLGGSTPRTPKNKRS